MKGRQLFAMRGKVHSVRMQVLHGYEVVRFEIASMDDQHVVAGAGELLDDGPPDEAGAAEDDNFQTAARTVLGFLSTIRSINPHFLASSGFIKKSRSIARSTASIDCPVCFV